MKRYSLAGLAMIVLAYLVIAFLYAVKTPAWQIPDEPAHYNYVRQIVTNGCCPTIQPGDWNTDYLDSLKAAKFSTQAIQQGQFDHIRYEDHQPPLYYLLEAPVYAATGGNLVAMRLLSALFGAGIVIAAWAIVQTVFPAQPWLALATAAFIAFLPQHVAMMAGLDNDSFAELLVALILLLCVVYLGNSRRRVYPVILGVLLGITFLTKLTAMLPMIGVVGGVVLLHAWRERWNIGQLLREAAWIAVPALIMGLPFWVHNVQIYGGLDFLGQNAHDRVVVGQETSAQYRADHGTDGWLRDGIQITFQSFWGQFGWMGVPMQPNYYTLLLAFTLFVIVGAVIAFVRWRKMLSPPQRDALIMLALTALLALLQTVGYNLKFFQPQGRYLYAGLIPIALFVAIGLAGWASLVERRLPRAYPLARWATVGVVCLFAVFDVYLLFRVIIPALA